MRVVLTDVFAQCREEFESGIGMEFFRRRHLIERSLDLVPAAATVGPRFGQFDKVSPLIATCARTGKESIDLRWMTAGLLAHLKILPNCGSLFCTNSRKAFD